jgi:fructokinase
MIVVIGEILFDIIGDRKRIGGAPFNFAFHLRQMGHPVRLITRVGDDPNGREIVDILRTHHFDADDIQIDKAHPTGVVDVVLDHQGVPQFDILSDAAYDHLDLTSKPLIDDRAQLVYFGTLLQRTAAGFDQVQRFLAQVGPAAICFCDLNLRPPHVHDHVVAAALRHADILKLNTDELAFIKAHWGGPEPIPELMAWVMQTFNVDTLALTRGDRGSCVVHAGQVVEIPLSATEGVVDTVGAGDAYAAVLAAGMLRGLPLQRTVALAADFAARICTIPGAIPSDPHFYDALR